MKFDVPSVIINNFKKGRTLQKELRSKYDIRDTGLNISIADIRQHGAFKQIAGELLNQMKYRPYCRMIVIK